MNANQKRSLEAVVVVTTLLAHTLPTHGHCCGPTELTLKVGETCAWRIIADRTESTTRYAPGLSGPGGVVTVSPLNNFMAFHGDFIITGTAPGTNVLDVLWRFDPPMEDPVIGFCDVTIVVEAANTNQPTDNSTTGVLTTYNGIGGVEPKELRAMFDEFIPQETLKLLVLGQCFGGDFATSEHFFDAPNIAVASATSRGQTAFYGGYHDDAARALKPGPNRTAFDMHRSGNIGKDTLPPPTVGTAQTKQYLRDNSEWPVAAGGIMLDGFSLENVTSNGSVRSRHIVVFMGKPEPKDRAVTVHDGITIPNIEGNFQSIADNADRDAIKQNFANELNTTVRTVGGAPDANDPTKGQNGWDLPGDEENLKKAIKEAGEAITNSPDPAAEQFILLVGDHGQQGITFEFDATSVAEFDSSTVANTWTLDMPHYMHVELYNIPHFDIEILAEPVSNGAVFVASEQVSALSPSDFELELRPDVGMPLILSNFTMHVFDLDDDVTIGSMQGEGIELFFPVSEHVLLDRFEGVSTEIVFHNNTGQAYQFQDIKLLSGSISKPATVIPEPLIQSVKLSSPGQIELTVYGPPGEPFMLQSSNDGMTWQDHSVANLTSEFTTIVIPAGPSNSASLFRLEWIWP